MEKKYSEIYIKGSFIMEIEIQKYMLNQEMLSKHQNYYNISP